MPPTPPLLPIVNGLDAHPPPHTHLLLLELLPELVPLALDRLKRRLHLMHLGLERLLVLEQLDTLTGLCAEVTQYPLRDLDPAENGAGGRQTSVRTAHIVRHPIPGLLGHGASPRRDARGNGGTHLYMLCRATAARRCRRNLARARYTL